MTKPTDDEARKELSRPGLSGPALARVTADIAEPCILDTLAVCNGVTLRNATLAQLRDFSYRQRANGTTMIRQADFADRMIAVVEANIAASPKKSG